jgi:peptidoglycan/LPS O-acetylase OafA/YrhL
MRDDRHEPDAFRHDIQGLRAVSVLAVVLYHAKIPGFGGGFVGVDIFFVISGYLIAALLLREWTTTGTIDLIGFWSRRARRLLPNALATVAVTLAAAVAIMPTTSLIEFYDDALSTITYWANYRFARRAVDYFDQDLRHSPLLHFWSLNVEEHFYVALPLVLLGVAKLKAATTYRTARTIFFALAALSFAAFLWQMSRNLPKAFFHTEGRVWQIAIGGLLASSRMVPGTNRYSGEFAGYLAGIAGIAITLRIALFGPYVTYPAVWAILPSLAAAAIIAAHSRTGPVAAILHARPMQWIGKRSYSIYLWHWPIFTLLPLAFPELPMVDLIALGLVIPVAAIAFDAVEEPFRTGPFRFLPPIKILGVAAAASAALALLSFGGTKLWVYRDASQAADMMRRVVAARNDTRKDRDCTASPAATNPSTCRYGKIGSNRVAVLFGDSFAHHLVEGLNEAAIANSWELRVQTRGNCTPADVPVHDDATLLLDVKCAEWREKVLQSLIAAKPAMVVLSTRVRSVPRKFDAKTGRRLAKDVAVKRWMDGFTSTINRLTASGIRVLVVRSTPESVRELGLDCLLRAAPQTCATPLADAVDLTMPDMMAARGLANVHTLDLTDRFCAAGKCPVIRDGMIVYRDNLHLTAAFSKSLAPAYDRFFNIVGD